MTKRAATPNDWLSRTFQSVIMQPTTLCNLDCRYCYLPLRKERLEMPPAVAKATANAIHQQGSVGPVSVVWHGGEPLTLPIARFEALLAPFEEQRQAAHVQHCIQTNATMIDDTWCELFTRYDVRVGVSLDGTEPQNAARVDRAGRQTFDRTSRGLARLRAAGIPFSLIAVVGSAPDDPTAMLDHLEATGAWSIGFNVEETEGVNTDSAAMSQADAETFWRAVIRRAASPSSTVIYREVERVAQFVHTARTHGIATWRSVEQDPIPTIAWDGSVTLLSPELAGFSDPKRGSFVTGNVLHSSLETIIRHAEDHWYVRDFGTGIARCQAECDFYAFCLGAHASNRYFENGNFTSTETNHCRLSKQALVQAMANVATGGAA